MERFWSKVNKTEGCWLWISCRQPDRYGKQSYGLFFFEGKSRGAHRVAWQLTYGIIPVGMDVLHRCDVPPCVRPDHLFLGDDVANMRDMKEKGRQPHWGPSLPGELNPSAKLTNEQVAAIRHAYTGARGQQSALAREYGVTQGAIWRIVKGSAFR